MADVAIEYDFGVSKMHRFESYCYGAKNCRLYKMVRARSVHYKGRDCALDNLSCYNEAEQEALDSLKLLVESYLEDKYCYPDVLYNFMHNVLKTE